MQNHSWAKRSYLLLLLMLHVFIYKLSTIFRLRKLSKPFLYLVLTAFLCEAKSLFQHLTILFKKIILLVVQNFNIAFKKAVCAVSFS